MIKEATIEKVLDDDSILTQSTFYEESDIAKYLLSESFEALKPSEQKELSFICDVIYNAYAIELGELPELDIDIMIEKEEENWNAREGCKNWDEAKDQFFLNYPQEDLLAFVEDSLSEPEDSDLTQIGTEVIFITAKSYIDSILDESDI